MSLTSIKKFTFFDESTSEQLIVNIPEVVDAAYGLYVWPSAPVLAQYIWSKRAQLKGKSVLEIGAGTALPGVVAAKCGASSVILSDCSTLTECQQRCLASVSANNLSADVVPVVGITWGVVSTQLLELPKLDLVLASDCFYDSKDFEDVVMTMSFLLHENPEAEVWFSYQVRSSSKSIEGLLAKWKLRGHSTPVPDMSSVECSKPSHSSEEVQLFVIYLEGRGMSATR